MVLIGLTGGVGMGKSTAARHLLERGIPVIDTDDLARALVEPGQPALSEIAQAFGPSVIGPDGRLLRQELAQVVFKDPAARAALEGILHPRIRQRWHAEAQEWRARSQPAGCVIIPLLYETGAQKELDRVVCVACSALTQRERLRDRGWSETEIEQRISSQMPVSEKLQRADYVLWTEGRLDLIALQWAELLPRICAKE
jgi:dephospho-CoA kinase